ncbi:MAG: hypothetical protein J5771_04725 [Bacteroidales bacterium]|nr:hypothetical protein [Bacteroidales bacterium]
MAKKLQEMTDDEVVKHMASAVRFYVERIRPYGEFVLEHCVGAEAHHLGSLFRLGKGYGMRQSLTPDDIQEFEVYYNHFLPLMLESARAAQLEYDKAHTIWKIRGTAATERIKKAFGEAKMPVDVVCQKHRAKVSVKLGGLKLRFYVRFKALEQDGDSLPGIVQAVLDLQDAAGRIGGDLKLSK